MKTITAYKACQSYGYRYSITTTNKSGMTSVYGMYGSLKAARRIAKRLAEEFGDAETVEVAQIVDHE